MLKGLLSGKIIAAAVVLLIAIGAVVGVTVYLNSPEVVVAKAIGDVFDDFAEREEFEPLANTLDKGSIEFSMSEFSLDGENLLGDDFEAKGKLYFSSSKKATMLDEFYLNVNGKKVGGQLYLSTKESYIKETELLDASVGIVKGELAKDFENSVFAFGSDSEYAIEDEEVYNTVIDVLTYIDELNDEKMAKDAEKLVKKYVKELWKITCEYAEIESENDKIKLNDGKKSARIITVTLDGKALSNILSDFAEFLESDDDVIKFIDKYEGNLYDIIGNYTELKEDSLSAYYENFVNELNDDKIDDICEGLEKMKDDITLEVVTAKMSTKLLKLTVSVGSNKIFTLDCGSKGIKKTDKIVFAVGSTDFVYTIEKSSKEVTALFEIDDNEIISYELNKKKGEYSFTFGEHFKLSGELDSKMGKTTITVDQVAYLDSKGKATTKYNTDITVVIDESAKMPKPDKDFDRISDYNQERLEELAKKLEGEE